MKTCDYCHIQVAGNFKRCPLCQNKLHGPSTRDYWPAPEELKTKSKLFKRQLGIVLLFFIIVCVIDLILHRAPFVTRGLFLLMWVIIVEFTLYQFVKTHKNLSGIFTNCAVSGIVGLLLSTFWYPQLVAFIPIPLIIILAVNFFITVFDRRGHVMIHFITFFLTGIISWIFIIVLMQYDLNFLWKLCFLVSCITLIGTIVIRGRDLLAEIQKRFMF